MRRMADPSTKLDKACATMGASYQIGRRPKRPVRKGFAPYLPNGRDMEAALPSLRGHAICRKML